MNIEVVREAKDGLSKNVWVFGTHNWPHLNLTQYKEMVRPTKRHKFTYAARWNSYTSRESTMEKPSTIPMSVIDDARGALYDLISSANVYIGASAEEKNILQKGELK